MENYMENIQLETLRTLVNRKNAFNIRLVENYQACQSLIIPIDTWLRKIKGIKDGDTRRDIRLYMYSAITQRYIGSTYDLYTFEISTIRDYIEEPVTYSITDDGTKLLEHLTKRYDDGDLPFESRSDGNKSKASTTMPDMSEAPF
jgi:hypothetical protein